MKNIYILHVKSCRAFKQFEFTETYECADAMMLAKAIRMIAQKWHDCKCWFENKDGIQIAYGYCNTAKNRYTYTSNGCFFEASKM